MSRISISLAQWTFDASNELTYRSTHASRHAKLLARAGRKLLAPFARRLGAHKVVSASLFGRTLLMPSEHPLPATLTAFPQYNSPLLLAVDTVALEDNSQVSIIDVGANVGDTVAMIEQHRPDCCTYLCIEADQKLADLCRRNHTGNSRVTVKQCVIGEEEGAAVQLQDDGRANPSTKPVPTDQYPDFSRCDRLIRLDSAAQEFAATNGHLSLIKVDTEGYDFSVLRSAPGLLRDYQPSILFEWYPHLLGDLGETVWSGFEYLGSFGYRYFVFFTKQGDYFCTISDPDRLFLRSLSTVALTDSSRDYFDVFGTTEKGVSDRLVEASMEYMENARARRREPRGLK